MPKSDLTIHQMRVFDTVARHGSISRAAAAMGLPQPAVSRMIGRIEENVEAPLLARSGGGVALTDAGKVFCDNITHALHFHDTAFSAVSAMRGRLIGEARLAAPESVGDMVFAPLIRAFKAAHPDAVLRVFSAQSASIPALLVTGGCDIAIVADTHPPPPGPIETIVREPFWLIGPASNPMFQRQTVSLAAVGELPLVLNALPGGFRSIIDAAFAAAGVSPDVISEIDANMPLLDIVCSESVFSILPYATVVRKPHRERLGAARIVDPPIERSLSIASARRSLAGPVVREAIRILRRVIENQAPDARWRVVVQSDTVCRTPNASTGEKDDP